MTINNILKKKGLFIIVVIFLILCGSLIIAKAENSKIFGNNMGDKTVSMKSTPAEVAVTQVFTPPPKTRQAHSVSVIKINKNVQNSNNKKVTVKSSKSIQGSNKVTIKSTTSSTVVKKSSTTSASTAKTTAVKLIGTPTSYKFASSELSGSQQIITVTSSSMESKYARINCYEKVGNQWRLVYANMYSLIGENGMEYDAVRKQNTNTTPSGVYSLPYAFGWAPNPGGLKIKYIKTTDNDYWNLNSGSPTYNQWVDKDPGGDREDLGTEKWYKYAIVIGYNQAQVPDKGGAIFMHLNPTMYTGGCVGISETNIVNVLRWLDPTKNPKIVICPESDLSKYN